jgi:predicted dehydrogenase
LFVHLLTGLHFATGSKGPSRVFATGGLRFWKDGRDVPDVMLALLDYPGFNARLKVNFASGEAAESFGVQFIGSEGTITVSFATLTLSRRPRETEPGYTIDTFPEAVQKEFLAEYHKKYPPQAFSAASMRPEKDQVFEARGVDAHQEHYRNFQKALLTRKPFFEDGVFGFRAAGPALLTNVSYFERRECRWDPEKMEAL